MAQAIETSAVQDKIASKRSNLDSESQGHEARFDSALRRLGEEEIPEKDKMAILELVDFAEAQGKAISTRHQYVNNLRVVSRRAEKSLLEMTKEDLLELMVSMANGTHPDVKDDGVNLQSYQIGLRNFVKVHDVPYGPCPTEGEEGYNQHPLTISDKEGIGISEKPGRDLSAEDMLYREEVDALLDACGMDVRYKALITFGLATGQRIDVIRTLRVGDIEWFGHAAEVEVNEEEAATKGKDGSVPLLWSKHYMKEWLEVHPCKNWDNFEDCAVFTPDPRLKCHGGSKGEVGEPLEASTIRHRLRTLAERADFEKDLYPHLLRHTAISRLCAQGVAEQDIKQLVGWSKDSSQFSTYAHVANELSNNSMRRQLGLPVSEETDMPVLGMPTLLECPGCGDQLPDDVTRCENENCGQPLTQAEYVDHGHGAGATEIDDMDPSDLDPSDVVDSMKDDPDALKELGKELTDAINSL